MTLGHDSAEAEVRRNGSGLFYDPGSRLGFNILAGADLVTVADVIMLAEELRPEE